jgi:hypothetical protein
MRFWTQTINAPLTITQSDGAFFISVLAQGGSVSILGGSSFQGMASQAATIANGNTWTYSTQISEGAINVTITPSANASIMIAFN